MKLAKSVLMSLRKVQGTVAYLEKRGLIKRLGANLGGESKRSIYQVRTLELGLRQDVVRFRTTQSRKRTVTVCEATSVTLAAIPAAIHQIDREIAVSAAVKMTDRIENSSVAYLHRSSAWLVGGFAGIAFILGVLGLYGVVAYSVGHRTREIGVRMALGADPGAVYRLILGEASRLVGAGTVLGIGGSLAAATSFADCFTACIPGTCQR